MMSNNVWFRIVRRAVAAATIWSAGVGLATAQQGIDLIQNRWTPAQYLNVQSGRPVAGPASPTAALAQWAIEPTADGSTIRLRNVGTNLYLQANASQLLVAAAPQADGSTANWTLERVPGIPDPRIRNSATGGYLHTKDGPLVIGEASPQWQQSFWKFIPVSGGGRIVQAPVADTIVPAPPPASGCKASNGKWLWIKGQFVCAHGCTPGFHIVGNACVANCGAGSHPSGGGCVKNCAAGFHPAGNTCVKNCPVGFHPVGGLCVKTCGPGFHPVGNKCVPNGPACGPGHHMSQGHCCPNGKNWNGKLKKCT